MKRTKCLAKILVATSALLATLALGWNAQAQGSAPGKAEVRAVIGTASYSPAAGQPLQPLKQNDVLGSGATIKTGPGSMVDLFLGNSAGRVRVVENTTLALDKLALMDTGADTVVEVQLNVPEGVILGNVAKLATASKYEIKVPNGVAGIRGTDFRISSSGFIVLLKGTLIFVHVKPDGKTEPHTLNAPPAVYFSPIEGIKPAPEELIREVQDQFKPLGPAPIAIERRPEWLDPATAGRYIQKPPPVSPH